ncbi:MAG: hypothetical protein JWO82_110 [Akkermansiaceae bacterium]|nr:hypothetical protein [Akkermansiaceae bacterium]
MFTSPSSPWSGRSRLLACTACLLPPFFAAHAAEQPAPVPELEKMVVTGQTPDDLEEERIQSPVPEVGLNREGLKKQAALRLGDSLKFTPGVYFGGDINENKNLQLRGLPTAYSRVQLGGVQIPDGGEERQFELNRFPAGLFQKARVIRNPSAEYESDGIGGRLDLETIAIPQKFEGELRLGYGARARQNPLWNVSAMAGGRPLEWFGLLGAVDYGLDPFLKNKDTYTYEDGKLTKVSQRREHKELESYSAFLDAGFFYEDGEFHIKPMFLLLDSSKRSRKDTRDLTKAAGKDESIDQDFEEIRKQTSGFTASSLHRWSDRARQDTLLSYYKAYEHTPYTGTDSYKESGGSLKFDEQELQREYKEDVTWDVQTKTTLDLETPLKQQLKIGAAYRNKVRDSHLHEQVTDDDGNVDDLTTASDTYHLTEDYLAGFVQDQIWLTDEFSIMPGLRAEYVKLRSHDGSFSESTRSTTDWNPTLHLLYEPKKDLAFHLSFSRTVNRPQFDQLSPYRKIDNDEEIVTVGNPDLDPARSWNSDLGVDWKTGPLFLGANVFYKKISDVIQEDRTGTTPVGSSDYDLYQYRNVGDGFLKGIELDQRYDFSLTHFQALHGIALWANQSIYTSHLKYDGGGSSSFEEQPKFIANVGIDYEIERTRTRFTLSGNFVDTTEWHESDGTALSYTPEWLANLAIRQPLGAGLEAFLEIRNLADTRRRETELSADGELRHEYTRSGRTILAGVNYKF